MRTGRNGATGRTASSGAPCSYCVWRSYVLAEIQLRLDQAFLLVAPQVEAEFLKETLCGTVLEEHVGGDAGETFDAGDLKELL